jgi:NAD+ kinase
MSPKRLEQVLIVAKADDETAASLALEIHDWLARHKIDSTFEESTAASLRRTAGLPLSELTNRFDLAIVVGGDGTLLSVSRAAAPHKVPLLGVNRGSLGFLTELQPEELTQGLEHLLAGKYQIEQRQTLRVQHFRSGQVRDEFVLLNDAVVTKSALARMLNISLSIDGDPVAVYTSDGLIVSTPTGSTAYSLSAGGPILDPRMQAFVVTPICPHTMTYRPLVVPATVTLEIQVRPPLEAVYVTLDGQIGFPLEEEDHLKITVGRDAVNLIRLSDRNFFEVLRRKLRWGARTPTGA